MLRLDQVVDAGLHCVCKAPLVVARGQEYQVERHARRQGSNLLAQLDAVAIGQVTPGPLFTSATFIGAILAGWPGAVVATVAIFLPAFVFVALTQPLIPRIRRSTAAAAFLDGVIAASLGLIAAVAVRLGQGALVTWPAWVAALLAFVVLVRWRVNSAWLIAAGAAAGLALSR